MNLYLFAAYCAALILIIVLLVLFLLDVMNKKNSETEQWFRFIKQEVIPEISYEILNTMEEGMDIIPRKLKEIKQEVEDEDEF